MDRIYIAFDMNQMQNVKYTGNFVNGGTSDPWLLENHDS